MRVRSLAGVAALAAAGAGVAQAQDAPAAQPPQPQKEQQPAEPRPKSALEAEIDLLDVEEVVVTAARPAPRVPLAWTGGRTILGPEEMRTAGQPTLQEVLARVPGVYVEEEAGIDTKVNLGLRGVRAERSTETAVLVDGIPICSAPYAHPGQSLFPFVMERAWSVDVMRSGHATRYGPNNVVGVVNILTPPIPVEPTFEERVRIGEFGYRSAYTFAGGTWGDFGVLFEDVRKYGDTYRENGRFRIESRGAKVSWRLSDTARLLFQYDVFNEREGLAGGLSDADYEDEPFQTRTPQDLFEGDQQRGNVRFVWEPDADTRLEVLAYAYGSYRTFHLGSPVQYGDAPTRFQDTPRRFTVAAVAPSFTTTFRVCDDVENTVSLGTRLERDLAHTVTDRFTVSSGVTERTADQVHEYVALASYVEDTLRLWDRLSLTGGLRHESMDIDALDRLTGFTVNEDVSKTFPSVGASFDVTDEVAVFGQRYRGFRAPSYSQVIPSAAYEGIALETSKSWDYGVRALLGDGALAAEATRFDIDFENRFITDPNDTDHQINAGAQRQRGWELGANSDLGRVAGWLKGFRVYATATFLDTEQLTGEFAGNELSDQPRRRFAWGVAYRHDCGFSAGLDGRHVSESFGDADNETTPSPDGVSGRNPAYTVWSARLGYETALDSDGRWTLGAEVGVTNLFDEEAFNRFGSRGIVPIAPRAAYLGLSLAARF